MIHELYNFNVCVCACVCVRVCVHARVSKNVCVRHCEFYVLYYSSWKGVVREIKAPIFAHLNSRETWN